MSKIPQFVMNSLNSSDVNWGPLSETNLSGRPCLENRLSNTFVVSLDDAKDDIIITSGHYCASWLVERRMQERSGMSQMRQNATKASGAHTPGTRKGAWMTWGTTECPWCSRLGDLLKQKVGKSTLEFPPGGAGGW